MAANFRGIIALQVYYGVSLPAAEKWYGELDRDDQRQLFDEMPEQRLAERILARCLGWSRNQAAAYLEKLTPAELNALLTIGEAGADAGELMHYWLIAVADRQAAEKVTPAAIDASQESAKPDLVPSPNAPRSADPAGDEARAASDAPRPDPAATESAGESQPGDLVAHTPESAGSLDVSAEASQTPSAASPETPVSEAAQRPSPSVDAP